MPAACAGAGAAQGVVYARFAIDLSLGWAAARGVLWGLSYFLWRRRQATPASA